MIRTVCSLPTDTCDWKSFYNTHTTHTHWLFLSSNDSFAHDKICLMINSVLFGWTNPWKMTLTNLYCIGTKKKNKCHCVYLLNVYKQTHTRKPTKAYSQAVKHILNDTNTTTATVTATKRNILRTGIRIYCLLGFRYNTKAHKINCR